MRILQSIALALVIIGAINWGLIGFFSFDLVAAIFGGQNAGLARIIYALVGLSGLISISLYFNAVYNDGEANNIRDMNTKNLKYGTEFSKDENDDFKR